MATYQVCKKCGNVVEMKKNIRFEGGNEFIEIECPECGYINKTTISHVHYGNDAIKK